MLTSIESRTKKPLTRFLDTVGNGTGTKNAIGNYSGAITPFFIQPPAGSVYVIRELLFQNSDNGGYSYNGFAGGVALTNGILITLTKNGVTYDLLDGVPIKTNDQWAHIAHEISLFAWSGAINSMAGVIDGGVFHGGIALHGSNNDNISVTLHDDFSGLSDHTYVVHGESS